MYSLIYDMLMLYVIHPQPVYNHTVGKVAACVGRHASPQSGSLTVAVATVADVAFPLIRVRFCFNFLFVYPVIMQREG